MSDKLSRLSAASDLNLQHLLRAICLIEGLFKSSILGFNVKFPYKQRAQDNLIVLS